MWSDYSFLLQYTENLPGPAAEDVYAEDIFPEVTIECLQPRQLLKMEVSYLTMFRQHVHRTVGTFQEQHQYRVWQNSIEIGKRINVSHNLILTHPSHPDVYG